jgi:pyruvate kinase
MPVKGDDLASVLANIRKTIGNKDLWIDLKARQLRVMEFANTPYTAVAVSHRITVDLPATAWFDNGRLGARIVEIDGKKLILEGYAGRLIGPGESVNITDPSLRFLDAELLTPRDKDYVRAAVSAGLDRFMFSFVRSAADIREVRALCPGAVVCAKIEDRAGLAAVGEIAGAFDFVMGARGDLYTELDYPHLIVGAMRDIAATANDKAIAASRMFESLLKGAMPSCADISDIALLKEFGYRKFLIGDDICFDRNLLFKAIRIFEALFA